MVARSWAPLVTSGGSNREHVGSIIRTAGWTPRGKHCALMVYDSDVGAEVTRDMGGYGIMHDSSRFFSEWVLELSMSVQRVRFWHVKWSSTGASCCCFSVIRSSESIGRFSDFQDLFHFFCYISLMKGPEHYY